MSIGVIYALVGYAAYAFADAIIKGFGQTLSVYEIVFLTTVFSIIPVVITKPRDERYRDLYRTSNARLLHLRSIVSVCSVILVIYAFTTIPLAEVYALVFLTPVFVTVLSVLVLGETVRWQRWVLLFIGFAGIVVVVRPGFRDLHLGHLTAMGCAFFASAAAVILRKVSVVEKRTTIVAYSVSYQLVINGILMVGGFVWPTPWQWLLLALIGALGGTGHLLVIYAARNAPANLIAPTQYSQIIWAILLGAVFYYEYPDAVAYVGLFIVVVAGVLNVTHDRARTWFGAQVLVMRARRANAAAATPPPPDA